MKRLTFLLACFFISMGLAIAQGGRISGTVVDENNEPIIGASVVIKSTTTGTITDIEGRFNLDGAADRTLVISYLGKKKKEVLGTNGMKIVLEDDAELLDEVVVVAYGTAKKSAITGSATKVSGEKISAKSPTELSKALAGEVAGVQVFNSSGQPGSTGTIRIRGVGSVNTSSSPLYVVDGIPFGADLSGIDPSDIESTTVLKDASAAALYGTRAANGVILITTKKGAKGITRVEGDFKYGVNTRLIPLYETMTSPEEYIETTWSSLKTFWQHSYTFPDGSSLSEEQAKAQASGYLWGYTDNAGYYRNVGIYKGYNMWNSDDTIDPATGKVRTDVTRKFTPEKWDDHIFRSGQRMDGSVRISGGGDKTTYFSSLGYLKDEGYYIESDFQRMNVRSNIEHNAYSWLKTNVNLGYTYLKSNNPGQTTDANNGFQFVNLMPPIFPVFERDENGNKIPDTKIGGYLYDYGFKQNYGRPYASNINPAGAIKLDKTESVGHQFTGNAFGEARFLNDFKFTVNLGVQYLGSEGNILTNPYYGDAQGVGRIRKISQNFLSVTTNQILSWKRSFDLHTIDAFAAHEAYINELAIRDGSKSKLVLPGSTEWSNGVIMDWMNSDTYGYNLESYFGQIRYDYDEKYHLNLNIRRDGSSRFSDGNRWGTFGSVGGAWVLSKETFLENADWVRDLKFKASYGIVGNQNFSITPATAGFYPYHDLYTIGNLMDSPAIRFSYKGNPDLTWEKTHTFNTGFEFALTDYLEGEIEYFNKITDDMLYMKQMPISIGYASYPVNDGKMRNQGFEVTLKAKIINTNDVKFDFFVNGGHYQNRMLKMPIDDVTQKEKPVEVRGAYAWAEGHSMYDFYLREYAGVDPETGLALYNQYYNVKSDGSRELITNMEQYAANNKIEMLEVEKTDNHNNATLKYVGKSANPKFTGGFGFDLSVKGFELGTTFTYGLGGYAYDNVYATLMGDHSPGGNNWHVDMRNRWQNPGDVTDVPRLAYGQDRYTTSVSTRFLQSRSYLNLSNIRLGYAFPKNWLNKAKIERLSVFVSGDNLFMLTSRKGFVSIMGETGASSVSDYLPLSTIMGGFKVAF